MRKCVVVDIETTGLSPTDNRIIEIGAVKIEGMEVVERFSMLINPACSIPPFITELTGITDQDVKDAPTIDQVMPLFVKFAEGYHLLGHNIAFDYSFLKENAVKLGLPFDHYGMDTLRLAGRFITEPISKSLTNLVAHFGLQRESAHRAFDDAYATYQLYALFYERFYESDPSVFMPIKLSYKVRKSSGITSSQKKYLSDLLTKHDQTLTREITELTKSEASQEIDRLIRTFGR